MKQLAGKQLLIYEYICKCCDGRGYPPSVREICDAVGLRSTSTVHSHLNALESLGLISRDTGRTRAITLLKKQENEGIPILGTVAAGQPILAVEDAVGFLKYDAGDSGEFFALRIKGRSMINAGILDGDMVVVRRQPSAQNGQIVIALLGDEATCKRLIIDGGHIWLKPENEDYDLIDGTDAVILGKVTAVIRTY